MQRHVEVGCGSPRAQLFCIATYLPLRRWRDVLPFLRLNAKIERQLQGSAGLLRYGIKTNLPRKEFWTVSVWTDKAAAEVFVRQEPHATATLRFKDWAETGAAFVEWRSPSGEIDWAQALERLKAPTFRYGS
jgi:hypothetical protein